MEFLPECGEERRNVGFGTTFQISNAVDPLRSVRARGKRQSSRQAAEQCDELAPLHFRSQAQEAAS
jgi:hypothetical protein